MNFFVAAAIISLVAFKSEAFVPSDNRLSPNTIITNGKKPKTLEILEEKLPQVAVQYELIKTHVSHRLSTANPINNATDAYPDLRVLEQKVEQNNEKILQQLGNVSYNHPKLWLFASRVKRSDDSQNATEINDVEYKKYKGYISTKNYLPLELNSLETTEPMPTEQNEKPQPSKRNTSKIDDSAILNAAGLTKEKMTDEFIKLLDDFARSARRNTTRKWHYQMMSNSTSNDIRLNKHRESIKRKNHTESSDIRLNQSKIDTAKPKIVMTQYEVDFPTGDFNDDRNASSLCIETEQMPSENGTTEVLTSLQGILDSVSNATTEIPETTDDYKAVENKLKELVQKLATEIKNVTEQVERV